MNLGMHTRSQLIQAAERQNRRERRNASAKTFAVCAFVIAAFLLAAFIEQVTT